MRAFVVTGSSRGLGEQIVRELVVRGEHVIAVAHRGSVAPEAGEEARLTCDLSDLNDVAGLVGALHDALGDRFDDVVLVNNAGVIGPIRQVGCLGDPAAIADHLTVNYTAPVLLVDGLVAALGPQRRLGIVNITSGAAERPIPGWSLYCSSKKAIKLFLDVLDAENDRVTVHHVDPGVMDTRMQQAIREAGVAEFPGVERFRDYKATGRLRTPQDVARDIVERYLAP